MTCACGNKLHYTNPETQAAIQALVDELGEYINITVRGGHGTWRVQRHYIALHGITAAELPTSGMWERVA